MLRKLKQPLTILPIGNVLRSTRCSPSSLQSLLTPAIRKKLTSSHPQATTGFARTLAHAVGRAPAKVSTTPKLTMVTVTTATMTTVTTTRMTTMTTTT